MLRHLSLLLAGLAAASLSSADTGLEAILPPSDPIPAIMDGGVVITPVPMPGAVVETLILPGQKQRSLKKIKVAKKAPLPVIALSRTERRQMALLAAADTDSGETRLPLRAEDQNDDVDYDDQVLHRSYSRPRVAETAEKEDGVTDDEGIADHVKLRLMMARLKAVESLALAQAGNDTTELPDRVLSRLAEARQKAVEAHRQRHA